MSGRVLAEVAQPLYVMGVLGLSFGVGFIASAVLSLVLSRRLGLLEQGVASAASERGSAS